MTATTLIDELGKLPLTDRLLVIEQTLHAIRRQTAGSLEAAAEILYDDYKRDTELTIFSQLDPEAFYEAR